MKKVSFIKPDSGFGFTHETISHRITGVQFIVVQPELTSITYR